MRAWQLISNGEPENVLRLSEIDTPLPGPGQVLIEVSSSALALPDVMQCRGTYTFLPPRPMTPGLEFCGTVVAAGDDTGCDTGTVVMGVAAFQTGHGAFADYCLASATSVWPLAEGMARETAAAFTIAYHTGWIALVRRARLREGETVLIHGAAGGVGLAAIYLAKALGARVVTTSGGAEKQDICRKAGADLALDHQRDDWVQAVLAETGGRGADIVYDPVGGEMFEQSLACTAVEGRLLPVGYASGRWGDVSFSDLNLKNLSIVGALGGGPWMTREDRLAMHAKLLDLFTAGKLAANVERTIGFEDIPAGLSSVARREVRGRIVAMH